MSELIKALVAAQQEMKAPPLDGVNPHFNSKFSTLLAVRDTIIPTLNKHGIAVTQSFSANERGVSCTTHLHHASGETLSNGEVFIPSQKSNPHAFGGCATYARRYSLQAAVCIVGDPDLDANEAVDNTTDPRGDLGKKVPTKEINKWSKLLIEAAEVSDDRLWGTWEDIKDDHDLAVAVWTALPRPIMGRLKELKSVSP